MFIKNISFDGYGPFEQLDIPLWSEDAENRHVTILIGENGEGKSAFLEGIVTLLSWFTARVRSVKSSGSSIDNLKIHTGKKASVIKLTLAHDNKDYTWQSVKASKGKKTQAESSFKDATALATHFSEVLTENDDASLPLIAYYPTERYVLDIPKKIVKKHSFNQIDGYEAALTKGIDFRLFFEWFRNREDIQNEGKVSIDDLLPFFDIESFFQTLRGSEQPILLNSYEKIRPFLNLERIEQENPALLERLKNKEKIQNDPQYFATIRAIEAFMPGYKNLRIERKPRMRMLIDKGGQSFDILQLSQGERSLLALVGDIARRLATMNPALEDPLQGEGIILIDEVDLHLHPKWQRTIARRLRETFPCCQFILTTHSPLVISDPDNVQVIAMQDGRAFELPNVYGMDVEQVFLDIMDTPLRHPALQEDIDALLEAIQDKEFDKAKALRQKLAKLLPPDHRELVRADIYLRRQEALRAQNH